MSAGNTSCRLLPLLGAATLLALLVCQVSLAQQDDDDTSTDPTTTTTEGTVNNNRFGRGNIIIGGGFGFNDREKRRASRRRDGNSGGADAYSVTNYVAAQAGKRRKNRRRGGGRPQAGGPESDTMTGVKDDLATNIDILAQMNQDMADQDQRRPETPSRRRSAARRYFGGVGREIVGFPNRAKETLNNAVTDMLGGVNTVLRMLPYDEIEETALRLASYLETLVDSDVPAAMLDSLMSSRVGGFQDTMEALVQLQGSPDQLEPILEDIAENYRNLFQGAAGQVDDFLSLIMPRRQQGSGSNALLSMLSQLPAVLSNSGSSSNGGFAPPEVAGDSIPPPGAQA